MTSQVDKPALLTAEMAQRQLDEHDQLPGPVKAEARPFVAALRAIASGAAVVVPALPADERRYTFDEMRAYADNFHQSRLQAARASQPASPAASTGNGGARATAE